MPGTNKAALAVFVARKAETDAALERIRAASDDHFFASPESVHWGNIARDGRIRFKRQKSGGEVDLRILPGLADEPARLRHRVGLFLMTEEAKPKLFTVGGFGN